MITRTIDNFDISQICASGQCFRMTQLESGEDMTVAMQVVASGKYLELQQ